MKALWIGQALLMVAVVPAAATADPPPAAAAEGRAAMYEDIEIMRRLLNGKLHGFAGSTLTHWRRRANAGTADQSLLRSMLSGTYGAPSSAADHLRLYHNQDRDLLVGRPHALSGVVPSLLDTEGTYLKGQGVVFTLTLPPPAGEPRPEAPKPAARPPSDWERIRREVRHENEPEPKADATKEPTLAQVVLRALADNGKHFTHLGENESLTVVITFRADAVGRGVAMLDYDADGALDLYITNYLDNGTVQAPQQEPKSAGAAKPQAGSSDDTVPQKVRDLILLGELHAKQGKAEEAIQAFRQALKLKPDGDQARDVLRKLAATLLSVDNVAEAEQVMKEFSALAARQQEKPTAPPKAGPAKVLLPAKLIVSAPKKVLDQVGAGKISFEEFQKAATVEYLTFPMR
jgi:hypothetical protein